MDQRNNVDRDLIIKARFRFTNDHDDREDDSRTTYWNELMSSDDAKTPCYAFRRGNILFTTIPPARQPPPIQKSCTSTCKINLAVADRSDKRHGSDFCEVCCGIRSPSFSRRAHSFTTHFCTRVPAKKNINSANSSSDQRSKSTDSSISSCSESGVNRNFGNLLSSRGHISRLSAYLKKNGPPLYGQNGVYEEATSSDYTSEASSSCDRKSNNNNLQIRSGCDKCGLSSTNSNSNSTLATSRSRSSAVTEYSSYSSSYPSSCSSYMPFFLDESCSSSVCCDCSSGGANSTLSSFSSLRTTAAASVKDRTTSRKEEDCEKARFFSNDSSSDSDNETCSSEMGWSFGSFCQDDKLSSGLSRATTEESVRKSNTIKKGVNESIGKAVNVKPFVSSSNRKLVTEKFGDIVSTLRKPGHHVGPSKNSDCLCDNCRFFFCKK
ncbi:uncharacterized protein LOC135848162 [Planococcus citri]|uniref:uncharacterized protein LOC135848162 n=1 Tax=Planococcus citri TaxID=170843 RepID=UPI0031F88772